MTDRQVTLVSTILQILSGKSTSGSRQERLREVVPVVHLCGPRTRNRNQMHQYVGTPFDRIAIDVGGLFPRSHQGNRYLLIDGLFFQVAGNLCYFQLQAW
jgi:hypothetical protein